MASSHNQKGRNKSCFYAGGGTAVLSTVGGSGHDCSITVREEASYGGEQTHPRFFQCAEWRLVHCAEPRPGKECGPHLYRRQRRYPLEDRPKYVRQREPVAEDL